MTNCEATGWVACDYTQGDKVCDVRHWELRGTYEEARADADAHGMEGVRYAAEDGFLYVDMPDSE